MRQLMLYKADFIRRQWFLVTANIRLKNLADQQIVAFFLIILLLIAAFFGYVPLSCVS